MKPKTDDYYKKYRYLIWRGDIGFLHINSFSTSELKAFSECISKHIEERLDGHSDDADIKELG